MERPYKLQSLTIPTPNSLPGIKVDSGGNYTDASGQQWVCDEIDLERGKYVQRTNIVEASGGLEKDRDVNIGLFFARLSIPDSIKIGNQTCICNRLPNTSNGEGVQQ